MPTGCKWMLSKVNVNFKFISNFQLGNCFSFAKNVPFCTLEVCYMFVMHPQPKIKNYSRGFLFSIHFPPFFQKPFPWITFPQTKTLRLPPPSRDVATRRRRRKRDASFCASAKKEEGLLSLTFFGEGGGKRGGGGESCEHLLWLLRVIVFAHTSIPRIFKMDKSSGQHFFWLWDKNFWGKVENNLTLAKWWNIHWNWFQGMGGIEENRGSSCSFVWRRLLPTPKSFPACCPKTLKMGRL